MRGLDATTSTVISFIKKLEDDTSQFYEKLAVRYAELESMFLSFAKESREYKILVLRTYQETITDALETCFSFQGLDLSDYLIDTTLQEDTPYSDALRRAIELENKASIFYSDIAKRSRSLLATIPRVFGKIAENRKSREFKLKSLLDNSR